ncbi:hypothetical protein D018_4964B, partial [Vibrio parahaemolyticus VP2007-007]
HIGVVGTKITAEKIF